MTRILAKRGLFGCGPRTLGLALVSIVLLVGCDSSDREPPQEPPPAPAGIPPLSPTVVSLDDGHMVGTAHWPDGNTPDGGQGSPVEGLTCAATSPVGYHVHAHLSIFLNGEALAVPATIGFVAQSPTTECHYPLHTHDPTGLLHAHATMETFYTLGQFFSVWGQPLQRDNIAGLVGLPVVVYVTDNGVVRESTGDLTALQLLSHREITIQVGTPVASIPQFSWTGQ
ncbi:MAG TPA: hypothetical protein VKA43_04545 [Gammaproteobacteria bacterium]|nr:hypothetical protein [Gammaproteobacteria bacterium]